MKLLDLYYFIKPAIPHEVRLRLRGYLASRQRRRSFNVWPVNESAARQPEWWSGWPGGKQFAFTLTHDVEGTKGMERCRALAQLEMDLGFRSSFNFVPEGAYDTPSALLSFLVEHGFEIGVHDLHHDGSLYRSKVEFSASARRINEYLQRWQAVGFRSAFMFHNLEWLKELNVLYDASTFDTDPFEPQSDGANTIFPFWVPRSDGSGYVELPYTLPQDSTLFLVLGETTSDIWKRKLDWVAQHGGLALVNVHPDYIAFGKSAGRAEFPVTRYEELLSQVSEQFGPDVWCALPRDVAQFARESLLSITGPSVTTNALAEQTQ
jgi:peptidoglycan/xylan/chitin deacetylase (PgdA/CDA1 family)